MNRPRFLVVAGLIVMLIGTLDPLEGSIVILPGCGLVALGAILGRSRRRRWLVSALVLTAAGVGALWGLSALGGIGGSTGRSMWWGLALLPYPLGWILGLGGAILLLREFPKSRAGVRPQPPNQPRGCTP